MLNPQKGTELLLNPQKGTEPVLKPQKGTEPVLNPQNGTERMLNPQKDTEPCSTRRRALSFPTRIWTLRYPTGQGERQTVPHRTGY